MERLSAHHHITIYESSKRVVTSCLYHTRSTTCINHSDSEHVASIITSNRIAGFNKIESDMQNCEAEIDYERALYISRDSSQPAASYHPYVSSQTPVQSQL
jgi:hypothetical protein